MALASIRPQRGTEVLFTEPIRRQIAVRSAALRIEPTSTPFHYAGVALGSGLFDRTCGDVSSQDERYSLRVVRLKKIPIL
jgi:hypothetical protein